ncbi:hypothetical protein [Actinoplanes sp. NBRC 101535]|uniref:hypothetical protein n=1 Tax=Actinoplanes sp. NBRC 101535 TaxID=3032196 RepID=UPI0024A0BB73|nr:hypothetical protein [Actinoplanes sp. NBRC 101535]GLY05342.1 hypothetical protein Acsp01_57210 [Actinoplanes sp. NBRC 101535]
MSVPGEIVVRNCAVTVQRSGGWSWGAEPGRLPERVVGMLAAALRERYADQLAGEHDVEITEPVRFEVRVSISALLDGVLPATERVRTYPGDVNEAAAGTPGLATTDPARRGFPAAIGSAREPGGDLRGEPDSPDSPDPLVAAGALTGPASADAVVSARTVEILPSLGLEALLSSMPELDPSLAEAVLTTLADPRSDSSSTVPGTSPAGGAAEAAPHRAAGSGLRRRSGDVEVGSALPFLVAAALDSVDLLPAMAPALAGTISSAGEDIGEEAGRFAFVVALQVLGPLRHGWLRDGRDLADAAVSAGFDEPPDAAALTGFARRAAPALPTLAGLAGLLVCRGHPAGRPLLLAAAHPRHGGGILLVDPDGLFPISWTTTIAPVPHLLRAAGAASGPGAAPSASETGFAQTAVVAGDAGGESRFWAGAMPPLLVAGSAAGPGSALAAVPIPVLATLADGGVPLICDAPPVRGDDRWRRLGGRRRLWATAGAAGVPRDLDLALLTGQVDELVTTLAARWSQPLERSGEFGRTVALIAALGLGTLSWQLWRHREPPDPQLALARLGDLGATVRYGSEEVVVRLPLGRRFQDLRDRGVLRDVPAVPWFGGRTVTFTGG